MKKIQLILIFSVLLALFSGCNKTFTCECATEGGSGAMKNTYDLEATRRFKAKTECSDYEGTYDAGGVMYTTTCTLKTSREK